MAPAPSHCHATNGNNGAIAASDTPVKTQHCARLLDADEFRRQGRLVVDLIADYYAGMGEYPVHPTVSPGFLRHRLPAEPPSRREPDAFAAAMQDVRDVILPGLTHWQSPRHFAHFPASSSTAGALGEALAGRHQRRSLHALHLPERLLFAGGGGGSILGTTCEAILCALVAARDRKLAAIGEGRIGDLVVYCSDQTHFAFCKAARIAGIRGRHSREMPTYRDNAFGVFSGALRAAMRREADAGLVPLFVCATVGTTQTTAVDPVGELRGAVAGGVEAVDSFSMNAHKWLLANNDCCVMWVRTPSALVAALGTDQEYILKDAAAETAAADGGEGVVDYKDWGITLTRRFRALKLWLVLRCYGVEGLREHIRSHVGMAAAFEGMVRADARFEVVTPRRFALVCFRLRSPNKKTANELNRRLLEEVNAASSGPYMSSANVGGVYMLRCAVGSTLTEERHVREAWKVVQDRATSILSKMEIIM
ncbi:hypothetical protein OsJ_31323 [Oryza sativa Japonica Group]|uniref:Uncharacterized protein n=1 Tax=Oryza sativa subsp. japonica TaxID=39947 RepID=B9G5H1_ORYSJ|nr:hypothetical protein OsJ_31323 [Oryza sativa Japonica Group]